MRRPTSESATPMRLAPGSSPSSRALGASWCENSARLKSVMCAVMVRPGSKPKGLLMSLDTATVRRIAKLARIRVDDADVATLQTELNSILGYVEQLNEVNVDGVEPLTGGAQMAMRLREDVRTDGEIAEKILANAPDRVDHFFAVPKVVE